MRRSLRRNVVGGAANLRFILSTILRVRNWWTLLVTLVTLRNRPTVYQLRHGPAIRTKEGVDAVTLYGVFVRQDYGEVQGDAVVIDLGAHIGIYSVFCASQARNAKVYAYEPVLENFRQLQENIQKNGLESRIHPFRLGVAGSKGKRQLHVGQGSPFHSFYAGSLTTDQLVEIDAVTLQDCFLQNGIKECDILKLDCEGAEFECLYETPPQILGRIKNIRLEYHNQWNYPRYTIADLTAFLQNQGFLLRRMMRCSPHSGLAWFGRDSQATLHSA